MAIGRTEFGGTDLDQANAREAQTVLDTHQLLQQSGGGAAYERVFSGLLSSDSDRFYETGWNLDTTGRGNDQIYTIMVIQPTVNTWLATVSALGLHLPVVSVGGRGVSNEFRLISTAPGASVLALARSSSYDVLVRETVGEALTLRVYKWNMG